MGVSFWINMFKKLLYFDLRSLALTRFLLGLILFYDFLRRIPFVEPFFSDVGIISRSVHLEKFHNIWKLSLLMINGSPTFAYILLGIGMIASLLFAIGARTRVMSFIIWLILISFHERFPLALNAGDILVTIMVFWSFFLPMNARASWDRGFENLKNPNVLEESEEDPVFFNLFTFGWLSLIFSLYLFTFLYKWHPDWFKEANAIYYALNLDSFTTDFGKWLLNFPSLLKAMALATLTLEGAGPFLILIPFKSSYLRSLVILSFLGLHIGIGLTMTIGTFPLVCCILWLPLIPHNFWDHLSARLKRKIPVESYHIYFDKDCGFCRKMVYALKSLFLFHNVKIHSSEVDKLVHKEMMKKNSWAGGVNKKELSFEWENFKRLAFYSLIPKFPQMIRLLPNLLGSSTYRLVAVNRGFFADIVNLISYSNILLKPRKLTLAFGLYCILLSLVYNISGFTDAKVLPLKGKLRDTSYLLRLNQRWNMFAPYPAHAEGWIVVDGLLTDGTHVDPWRNGAVDFSTPKNLADEFSNNVWRKYVERIGKDKYAEYRLYFGKYICRTYNHNLPRGAKRLQSFQIYYMTDETPQPGFAAIPINKRQIWSHDCFKKTEWPN